MGEDVGRPLWGRGFENLQKDLKAQQEFQEAGHHLEAGDVVVLDGQEYEVVDFRRVQVFTEPADLGVAVPVESDEPTNRDKKTENKIVVRPKQGGKEIIFNLAEFLQKVKK